MLNCRTAPAYAVLALLALQLVLLGFSLPLSHALSGWANWHVDHPYHIYQLELGRALLKQGELTGFDPFFAGGYAGGVTYNLSARLPVLIAAVMPSAIGASTIYTTYILVCALAAPLGPYLMARQLGWSLSQSALAGFVGLAYWWIGAMHWLHTAGMASFVGAAYLGLAYGAWLWNVMKAPRGDVRWRHLLALGLLGGLGTWLHPLFALLPSAMLVCLFALRWRELAVGIFVGRGLLVASLALAMNVPWIAAMLGAQNMVAQSPYQKDVGLGLIWRPLVGIWSQNSLGTFLNPVGALVCLAGMFWLPPNQRKEAAPLLLTGAVLLLLAAFGAAEPHIAGLQPNRFVGPAFLCIGIAAAFIAVPAAQGLRARAGSFQWMIAVPVLLLVAFTGREMLREAMPGPHGHYGPSETELTATPALVAQLADWISTNTSADGRILFETSLARLHGGGHTAGLLAHTTQREFVGGAYPHSLPETSFWDNVALGHPVARLDQRDLAHTLELYNVGWAMVHSKPLTAHLERLPNVAQVAQIGPIAVFRVERALSYAEKGAARVAARAFNRLDIEDASGPELILRYHWVAGLKAEPAVRIEPVVLVPGQAPFIRVLSPPNRFTLSTCRFSCD